MPPREVMRRWREGQRAVERLSRQERLQLTPEQRLQAIEQLYEFLKVMFGDSLHRAPCNRWKIIKRKWLQGK